MNIKLINPNTTQSMSDGIQQIAESVASKGTRVTTVTADVGPAFLECFADQAIAAPSVLKEIIKGDKAADADAYIIACFSDPGLSAARQVTEKPVIGIGQAAISLIKFVAPSFSILDNVAGGTASLFEILRRNCSEQMYKSTRFIGMSVLEVEENPDEAYSRLVEQIKLAIEKDGAEGVILGCAGFAQFADRLKKEFPIPIIDGVSAAVKTAEMLIQLEQKTAKVLDWGYPSEKEVRGYEFMELAQKE